MITVETIEVYAIVGSLNVKGPNHENTVSCGTGWAYGYRCWGTLSND